MSTYLNLLFLIVLIPQSEREWTFFIQKEIPGSVAFQRQWDSSVPDLITQNRVFEIDWSYKWKEGIGQAAYYSGLTGKEGTLIILLKDGLTDRNKVHLFRALIAANRSNIKVWIFDCTTKTWLNKR